MRLVNYRQRKKRYFDFYCRVKFAKVNFTIPFTFDIYLSFIAETTIVSSHKTFTEIVPRLVIIWGLRIISTNSGRRHHTRRCQQILLVFCHKIRMSYLLSNIETTLDFRLFDGIMQRITIFWNDLIYRSLVIFVPDIVYVKLHHNSTKINY